MRNLLFSPDADPPGGGPPPGAPPAAQVVVTGTKTERELTLEADLEAERGSHAKTAKDKKDRETRIAELEDELHKLRSAPEPKAKRSIMEAFFEGED